MIESAPSLRKRLVALSNENPSVLLGTIAIGAQSGFLELYFDTDGGGLASVYQRDVSHVGLIMDKSVTVSVTTLDQIASKYSLPVIDYLKLDLEGHELEALKGAKQLLDEKRIRAITFEFGGCNIDSRTYIKDFWTLLVNQYGFTFYRLAPQRWWIKLGRYSESLERFSLQNILACAPGVEP
jgi:FkbM family methyltransferase